MADNSINLNDSSSPVLAAGGIISNLPSSSSQRQTRKSKTMTSPNSNNNNSNSNAATTPANHQSEQLALHLIKRELLRVQTAIDKETIHNNHSNNTSSTATPYNDLRSLEHYLLSTSSSPSKSQQLLGELTILLWKKFDQLQSLRGVPSSKRWIASNNNNNDNTNDKPINQFGSPLEALLFEESQRVPSLSSPSPASGGGGTSTGSLLLPHSGGGGGGGNYGDEVGADEDVYGTSEHSGAVKKQQQQQQLQKQMQKQLEKELSKVRELLENRSLIRTPSIRPETIRAISSCCQLDADTEAALRQGTGALQRQRLNHVVAESSAQQQKRMQSSPSSSLLLSSSCSSSLPATIDIESLAADIDLDALLRRMCATIETFAAELAFENSKKTRSTPTSQKNHQQEREQEQQLRTVAGTPQPSPSIFNNNKANNRSSITRTTSTSTPTPGRSKNVPSSSSAAAVHRMLLPPMSSAVIEQEQQQQQQQQQRSPLVLSSSPTSANFNASSQNNVLESSMANRNSPNSNNNNNTTKRMNEVLERERRQHAIEASEMEDQIDFLSRKVHGLEEEIARIHDSYKQKAKQQQVEDEAKHPSQQSELNLTKQRVDELNDTCSGLQRVRKEESKRSLQIINDLEKQVTQLQEVLEVREMEVERLKAAIESMIDLHLTETQQLIYEHEVKTEFAEKKLLLHEQTYPHSLVVENHQLREKLFETQCQSDDRERTLALTQQKLRDVKEQLAISDAEANGFITKLKSSKEWRALTLAAEEEETVAAAVEVINSLFDDRKHNLKQQEEAQANRYRMLEMRLGEEVVHRRQNNVQNLAAPDAADKMLKSYQEQVKGMEDIILKKKFQKNLENYFFKSIMTTTTSTSSSPKNNKLPGQQHQPGGFINDDHFANSSGNNTNNNDSASLLLLPSSPQQQHQHPHHDKSIMIPKMKSEMMNKIVKRAFLKKGISAKEIRSILGLDVRLEE